MELSLPPSRFRRTIEEDIPPLSRPALIGSVIFHVSIVVLTMISMPFLESRPLPPPVPIMVEFIEVAEESASPKVSPKPPAVASKEAPKKAEEEKKPQPKTNKAESLEELVKPEPPKLEKQESVPAPAPEKPKEKPKPPEPKAVPEPVKKEEPKPEPEKVIEQPKPDPFASILKNLADVEDTPSQEAQESNSQARFPEAVLTRLGATLTLTQQDALRSQLAQCWNLLPGARDAENLVVDVYLTMNPDATVRTAEVVNKSRYNSDSFFRAAADSALRAVRHPKCVPLRLPLDKYNQWRTITITFDPREMF